MSLKLLVGLGNPGSQYEATRHNVGAWWLQAAAHHLGCELRKEKKFFGLFGECRLNGQKIMCLLPTTYMNQSGRAIASVAKFYQLEAEEILVAHDELDLPPGLLKLKKGGGHGGHNGLRDIIPQLGADFYRLRLGIGHPGDKHLVTNYVLARPSLGDQKLICNTIDNTLYELSTMAAGNWEAAMNVLHQKPKLMR